MWPVSLPDQGLNTQSHHVYYCLEPVCLEPVAFNRLGIRSRPQSGAILGASGFCDAALELLQIRAEFGVGRVDKKGIQAAFFFNGPNTTC